MDSGLYVLPGDVFFTHGKSVLGTLIRWAQTGPDEEPTWANHVGVVTKAGWLQPPDDGRPHTLATVIESLWHTQEWEWWANHQNENTKVRVYRYKPLTRETLARVLEVARRYVGNKYGWWKLLIHLADRAAFGNRKVFANFMGIDKRPICSYTVAKSFGVAGIRFDIEPEAADPDEMMDYCETSPDWAYVGEIYVGKAV